MKDTDKVELTVGDIKRGAEKCGTAKEILKELFPEVFRESPPEWEDVTGRASLWCDGQNTYPIIRIDGIKQKDGYLTGVDNYSAGRWRFKIDSGRLWRRKSQ